MKKKISLTSLNIKGDPITLFLKKPKARYKKLCKIWNASSYDVLQVQEIYFYSQLTLFRKELKSYPYVLFKKSLFGPKGGLVTFSRISIDYYAYYSFSKQWLIGDRSMVTALFPNGFLVLKLKDVELFFINTHLLANYQGNWTRQGKYFSILQFQAKEFQRFIKRTFSSKSILIASGDYNIAKKSDLYSLLKGDLTDIFAKDNFPTFHNEFLPEGRENNRVDFIFIKGNKNLSKIVKTGYSLREKVKVLPGKITYVSDHIGLDATLVISI